ncbi:MAG: hypothetical protein M3540_08310 [Actinomycetota bacterium]|nr:hypothetical protein [Actinomycetota bacterium]
MHLRRLLIAVTVGSLLVAPTALAGPSPHMYEGLIRNIQGIDNPNIQPLLASAEASQAAFLRGNFCAAFGSLGALEKKIDDPNIIDDPNARLALADIAAIQDAFIEDPNIKPSCVDDPNI